MKVFQGLLKNIWIQIQFFLEKIQFLNISDIVKILLDGNPDVNCRGEKKLFKFKDF